MVVHEKALVQEMKDAYKGWGYTVILRPDDRWVFKGDGWLVQIHGKENVPREVLSLIVLHMGDLPKKESACRVYKIDTGPAIQKEVFAVANEEIKKLEELTQETDADPVLIQRTKLMIGTYRVWQKDEDLEIFLMNPGHTRLIDSKQTRVVENYIFTEGDISWVYVCREIGAGERAHIDHLAQMQWIEK